MKNVAMLEFPHAYIYIYMRVERRVCFLVVWFSLLRNKHKNLEGMYMKNFLKKTNDLMKSINGRLSILCGLLLFTLMILLIFNILFRELGLPVQGLMTIGILMEVAVVYLGLASAEQLKQHSAIDAVQVLLTPKWKKYNKILVDILTLIMISIFFVVSLPDLKYAIVKKEVLLDVIDIYTWPTKLAISIGLGFYVIQIIISLIQNFIPIEDEEAEGEDKEVKTTIYNV